LVSFILQSGNHCLGNINIQNPPRLNYVKIRGLWKAVVLLQAIPFPFFPFPKLISKPGRKKTKLLGIRVMVILANVVMIVVFCLETNSGG